MTVPATQLALEYLGRPVPNAVLLGAFASLTNVISLESVNKAITERFSSKLAAGNCAAATAAYEFVRTKLKEPTHA
jgi:pyruvate ferredoxin oxidoreductase gamma subunit